MTAAGWTVAGLMLAVGVGGLINLPALMYTGDARAWRQEARSIILFDTLAVDSTIARTYGHPGQFFVFNPRNGNWYSKYGIVNGLLNVPPLLAEQLMTGDLPARGSQLRPLFFGVYFVLFTVAIAWLLYAVTGYYVRNPLARATFVLLAFYTTYLWNYLRATNGESTQLFGFLLFWLFFVRFTRRNEPFANRPRLEIYLAWLALGILCQTKVSYLMMLPVFGGTVGYLVLKDGLGKPSYGHHLGPGLVLFGRMAVVPCALILLAQGAVHTVKFGSPFLSGYHQFWETDELPTVGILLHDFVLSEQWSLFVHFPLLLLALPFVPRFIAKQPLEATVLGSVFLLTLIVVGRLPFWRGEWCYGPRYFVFILPLLALPALYPLEWACNRVRLPLTPSPLPGGERGKSKGAAAFLVLLVVAAGALAFVQFQVHRLDFFFKYRIQPNLATIQSPVVRDYFANTNFAKINWDHVQCRGEWEKLPYYSELKRELSPAALERWERNLEQWLGRSNLWWFP